MPTLRTRNNTTQLLLGREEGVLLESSYQSKKNNHDPNHDNPNLTNRRRQLWKADLTKQSITTQFYKDL